MPGRSQPMAASAALLQLMMCTLACTTPTGRVVHPVQVLAHAASVVKVDRVEAPAGQRRAGIGQRSLRFVQALQHRIERLRAAPQLAVGVAALE
jgi:hypothetical protein